MRCKCGSNENVKPRFRDKEWMCSKCYASVWLTLDDWYDTSRLNSRAETLEDFLKEEDDE